MTDDDLTSGGRTSVGAPLGRIQPPRTIELPEMPHRPVTVHVEIDDEDGVRVQHDIELSREHANDPARLGAALARGIGEVASSYAANTAPARDGHDAAEELRDAIAARLGEM